MSGVGQCSMALCRFDPAAVVDFDDGPEWVLCDVCVGPYLDRLDTTVRSLQADTEQSR